MRKYLIIHSWLSVLYLCSNALYFYLDEGEEKCFIQEMTDQTLLLANYKCSAVNIKASLPNEPRQTEQSMMVEIKDPQKRTVLSRQYRHEGRFSYTSHEPGEHVICLQPLKTHLSAYKIRIDFDLQVGEHALNHSVHKKRMQLTDMEERYQELLEKAIEITKETDYLRYREEMFRGTTETISRRVLLWMIGETVLLIIIGVWQIENLRSFFESKKLV